MQIGPGIFATNESSQYEWKSFKAQVLRGAKLVLESYPAPYFFALNPIHLELRYVDVFAKNIIGKNGLFQFAETGTSLKIKLPKILTSRDVFSGEAAGRVLFQRDLKGYKSSVFTVDLASAKHSETGEDVVRMESKSSLSAPASRRSNLNQNFCRLWMGGWNSRTT